jgi:hypothetical protein
LFERRNKLRHTGASRYPERLAPSVLPLDPGFHRDDETGFNYSHKLRLRNRMDCIHLVR